MSEYLQTQRLILSRTNNKHDNVQFLDMLKNDGDFKLFCGIEFSETSLAMFDGYLEQENFFRIYCRDDTNRLLGYAGIIEQNGRSEIEFYIKRCERRKGYGYEAVTAILSNTFAEKTEEIYATTQKENNAAQSLLRKCGFEEYDNPCKNLFMLMLDPNNGSLQSINTVEFILNKHNFGGKNGD